ncbi:hypothetical protein UXP87_23690, partial [Enterobacter hormaechei]
LPLTAFNKLRSGIDWVLEKLGVINKESGTLDKTAAKANAAAQSGGYVPASSTYGGYQPYPAPAGNAPGWQAYQPAAGQPASVTGGYQSYKPVT